MNLGSLLDLLNGEILRRAIAETERRGARPLSMAIDATEKRPLRDAIDETVGRPLRRMTSLAAQANERMGDFEAKFDEIKSIKERLNAPRSKDMKNPFGNKEYAGPEPKAEGGSALARVQGNKTKTAVGPELEKWLRKNKAKAGSVLGKLGSGGKIAGAGVGGAVAGAALAKLLGSKED